MCAKNTFLFSEYLRARGVWRAQLSNCSSVASVTLSNVLLEFFFKGFFCDIEMNDCEGASATNAART